MKHHHHPPQQKDTYNYLPYVIIVIMIFITYVNGIGNGFTSDDLPGILNNTHIADLQMIFSRPLIALRPFIYYILYELGGKEPLVFRSLNISFHIGTSILAYRIIKKMTNAYTALLSACLFAIHPITVESVTWISAGSYTQYSFFLMLSLWLFTRSERNYITLVCSVLSFITATLSSEKSLIFPLILYILLLTQREVKKRWVELIPYIIVSTLWGIYFISEVQKRIHIQQTVYYQAKGFDNPLVQIPSAISSYLELFFWPDKLSLYHSELVYTPFEFGLRALATLAFFTLLVLSYKKSKYVFFWLSFFFISLIPTMLPLRISWIVAERYVYFGLIGLTAVLAHYLLQIKSHISKYVFYAIIAFLIMSLAIRTMIRNTAWTDDESLFVATARTAPSDFKTHNNMGWVYQKRGDYQNAIKSFKRAITINPYYVDGTNNLALAYILVHDYSHALFYLKKTIDLNPKYTSAYATIGAILIDQKKYSEAEAYFKKSLEIDPNYGLSYHNLAMIYKLRGNTDKAIDMYMKAITIQPNIWQAQTNLGAIYYTQQDYKKAEIHTFKAYQLNPSNVNLLISLGKIYMKLHNKVRASEALNIALKLNPGNQEALELLKENK